MDVLQAELASALVGVVITVLWRVIDRYLPDPNRPSPPGATGEPKPPLVR